MDGEDEAAVVERYARFARDEAPGRSPLYEEWAAGVAADPDLARILARIPASRRQPPLVFAVSRMLGAPEAPFPAWATWVRAQADDLVAEGSVRRLQTNEPQRCAALLPGLATIDGPLALLELGASAGLCLFPDRYSYRYRRGASVVGLDPATGPSAVVLECDVTGDAPLRMPEVVWRAGIDLAPLDAADPDDRRFLESLVWPGERGRVERIAAALDIAAVDPPLLIAGDASDPEVLRRTAALAPPDATLVVTTPGVLPHVPRAGRERVIAAVTALDAVWITIDPPGLHEGVPSVDAEAWGGFALARDGAALAAVDPLGSFVHWRASRAGKTDAAH
ncbi:DUF2332 domain-containing protein [Microbacterium sp. M3]|uniref:DUF2332 domain-containing protein n=1 Tax=Microbacterium arthrosphaerae TaxID=792652 RepID=A0ABU4GWL4_9MICO|nr:MULTISPECIES: DUF2332 domain-containing protein [Microbacterium]MDW4571458.1 DUF2332 domain-containing protein [Microbacterium arthrosphaerae]MDW7605313.1 DUF2332 domain-containing protein [Microbacterium sp. M3]